MKLLGAVHEHAWSNLWAGGKIPFIDGLRALAILLVLLTHIIQTVPGVSFVLHNIEWTRPLYNGWIGVDLFFVLSGFLVGSQVVLEVEKNIFSFKRFYLRRSFRIFPAYFSFILFVVIFNILFPKTLSDFSFSAQNILLNFLFLTNYLQANIVIPSWSLSTEEQFYVILPIFIFLFRKTVRSPLFWPLFSIMVIAFLARLVAYFTFDLNRDVQWMVMAQKVYFPFHTRMDALASGVLVGVLEKKMDFVGDRQLKIIRYSGLLLVTIVFCFGALSGGLYNTTIQYSLLAVGFSCILLSLLKQEGEMGTTKKILSCKMWVPIARLSYSIYLTHLFIIHLISKSQIMSQNVLIIVTAIITLTFLGAWGLFFLVESPFHSWIKKSS